MGVRGIDFFEESLSPVKAKDYEMGSDEGTWTVHHEYLDKWRRELDLLPPLYVKKEVSDEEIA